MDEHCNLPNVKAQKARRSGAQTQGESTDLQAFTLREFDQAVREDGRVKPILKYKVNAHTCTRKHPSDGTENEVVADVPHTFSNGGHALAGLVELRDRHSE